MEKILQDLNNNKKQLYLALAGTYCWGLAAHGYGFLNNSVSHDSLREFHAEILGNEIKLGSGRVFTPLYRDLLGSDITMPWFMGILALLWIGLAVFLTVRILRMDSKAATVVTAGVFATNIAVSATAATYIHDLDSYMFALLCAVAAVYLWRQLRWGWLPGALLLMVSLGIYQNFLFTAVTLVMLASIMRLLDGEPWQSVFADGLKAVAMILLGGILYFLVMKLMLRIYGVTLVTGEYNSMDLILHQSPAMLVQLVISAYQNWFRQLFEAYSAYPGVMIKGITAILFCVCLGGLVLALCSETRTPGQRILAILLTALLPLGMNLIHVMMIGRNHDLLSFSVWLFYVFVILIADRTVVNHPRKVFRWM